MPAENICQFEIKCGEIKHNVLFNGNVMQDFKTATGKSILIIDDWINDPGDVLLSLKLSLIAAEYGIDADKIAGLMSLEEINDYQSSVVIMSAKMDIAQQKKTSEILKEQSALRMQVSGQSEMIAELAKALMNSTTQTSSESADLPESE